ncbi:hypothetical protein SAMN05443247_03120 [Bradyrhizobium erythrophlei]|nr:hypothetical protein SAMN05443247_03120 [Bradyrhizobium erythrophlei]
MTDIEIGSHEKPDNAYGQNGSAQPSSLLPGQKKPNIKNVSPPTVTLPDVSWQTRDIGKSDIKAHDGLQPRTVSDGSPGGAVPKSLSFGREGKR